MSQHADVRDQLLAVVVAAVPASVLVQAAYSESEFKALARRVPAIGLCFAGRNAEGPRIIGSRSQRVNWRWDLYYMAGGPGPSVAAGTDIFSLLDAGEAALRGLSVLSVPGQELEFVDEEPVELLPTAMNIRQGWSHPLPTV